MATAGGKGGQILRPPTSCSGRLNRLPRKASSCTRSRTSLLKRLRIVCPAVTTHENPFRKTKEPPGPPSNGAPGIPPTKRFEDSTLKRVYEADTHPAVYDFEAWRKHRSDTRYVVHMITLFQSKFLKELTPALSVLVLISMCVGGYETALQMHILPVYFPDIAVTAAEPFQQASFALSLMLVFRINECYQRYVEARRAWGDVVHYCRNMVRQGMALFPVDAPELKAALVRWTMAFPRVFKAHLREDGDVTKETEDILLPSELELLKESSHRPITTLQVLGEVVVQAKLDVTNFQMLDANLTALAQAVTTCERILKNPIPLSYTRHSARFLVLWLIWLPFSMWEKIHWGIVPAAGIIGFLLLGIDEIAIQLEEPFGILPLETLCHSVNRNLNELAEGQAKVQGLVNRLRSNHFVSLRSMSLDEGDDLGFFPSLGITGPLSSMDVAVLEATAQLELSGGQGGLVAGIIQEAAAKGAASSWPGTTAAPAGAAGAAAGTAAAAQTDGRAAAGTAAAGTTDSRAAAGAEANVLPWLAKRAAAGAAAAGRANGNSNGKGSASAWGGTGDVSVDNLRSSGSTWTRGASTGTPAPAGTSTAKGGASAAGSNGSNTAKGGASAAGSNASNTAKAGTSAVSSNGNGNGSGATPGTAGEEVRAASPDGRTQLKESSGSSPASSPGKGGSSWGREQSQRLPAAASPPGRANSAASSAAADWEALRGRSVDE